MKRHHRLRRSVGRLASFCRSHKQLLLFVCIIMLGAAVGCAVYFVLTPPLRDLLLSHTEAQPLPTDVISAVTAVVSSSFGVWCQLMALFLLGLTAFGCVPILFLMLFFGVCLGTAECSALGTNDWWHVLIGVTIPMALSGIGVLIGGIQAFRFSCAFSRQLLPGGAHCGGMWQPFKRYMVVFLLCLLITFASSALHVIIQCLL